MAVFDTTAEASHVREWPFHLGAACDPELSGLWHDLCKSFEDRRRRFEDEAWSSLQSCGISPATVWRADKRHKVSVYVQHDKCQKHLELDRRDGVLMVDERRLCKFTNLALNSDLMQLAMLRAFCERAGVKREDTG